MSQGNVKLTLVCVLVGAGLATVPGAAHREAAAEEPEALEALIEEAFEHNREIAAARQRLSAARWRIPQAWALPDPTFSTMLMGEMLETRLGPQEGVYEVEQMVPFPGKLWERRRIAVSEAQAARARMQATERDVALKVSEAYYDLYAVDATRTALEEIRETLTRLAGIAEARYASQGGAQRDIAKAQAELSDVLHRLFELDRQRQTMAALLRALLNRRAGGVTGPVAAPELPALSKSVEELLEIARRSRPELLEASAALTRERHARTLATMEVLPDVSVGFQYVQVGTEGVTDPNAGRDAWMVPLTVTVPLWPNRVLPAIVEARRNLRVSEAEFQQAENMTNYEVRSAYYAHTTARHIVELFENSTLPAAELAFRSDQAGFEAGRTDVLDLIDSERVYLSARVAYYQVLAQALKSLAVLERAVGVSLKEAGHAPRS